ncbi:MAG: fumarylacetoacetate hydrolase family protein [Xanthomonadales bacterium]|jgi:2-keto-4-pentenoate hydratase/2-oxohepta-3-ene-1,7-dioic acid hydratase in catechol pathway|nr:fumarylacetoacetate hydrolase family protein [Xanthomonadales bacterium]
MKTINLEGKEVFPSKIICIGRNYVDHIKELGNEIPEEPVIFIKPNSSIAADIQCSEPDEIHFEGEISIVVLSGEIAGVGFGLDLTKRKLQSRLKAMGLPWERSKAFDGAAVFSEFAAFEGQVSDLRLELHINDRLVQQGGCKLMMYKPAEIIAEVKSFLSLEDGDLIMTGTPAGVGPLQAGDRFNGKIFEKDTLVVEGSWVVQ